MESALDPKKLPKSAERKNLANKLCAEANAALANRQPLVASLLIADAVLLLPNDREVLDQFDEIALSSPDPLSLFPVATGAIHVATAAARARVLMMQSRLPDAIELIGRVMEVAPDLEYLDWVRRWIAPTTIPNVPWALLQEWILMPALRTALRVSVPTDPADPRLPNLRSAAAIFASLLPAYPGEKILYLGGAVIGRRLGDLAVTLQLAEAGVAQFPQDWGMRAALVNALCDAKRPDEAMGHAQIAMQIDPEDVSILNDIGHAFIAAGNRARAVQIFDDLLRRVPSYPNGRVSLCYARLKSNPADAEARNTLLHARDRDPGDRDISWMVGDVDRAIPFSTVLLSPGDASANYGRALVSELETVMRCCGQGASLSLTIRSQYPESPSVRIAFDFAMRAIGASTALMNIDVDTIPQPDPRQNKGRVDLPVWQMQNGALVAVYPQGHPPAQQVIGNIAYQVFRRETWDAAAKVAAENGGAQMLHPYLGVFTNPPPAPKDFDGFSWTYRCQIAAALVLSHLGPWETGPARAALYSLISGPSDWATIAGIVALSFRANDSAAARAEVENAYRWLRTLISPTGFTPWELALIECWIGLPGHPAAFEQELLAWRQQYFDTVEEKNSVTTARKYGGLTIEQYAEFSSERDRLSGGLAYGGVGGALAAAFSPSGEIVALCQKFGVPNPGYPFVSEWQEALNASPALMSDFIEAKRSYELGKMGINQEEKGALDNILSGNMDMHQRMAQAQAQAAQAEVAQSNTDPNPLVFPGQRVQYLSDYVNILKGMQQGNMMGALAAYGLDMMSYGQVAQAWAAKMAADPVLTDKFSRMMAG